MSNQESVKCTAPELGSHLLSYGLGSLNDADSAAFEVHLLLCPACQAELAGSSKALKALATNRTELVQKWKLASEDFESRYADQIKVSRGDDPTPTHYSSRQSLIWLSSAAACLIAVIFWFAQSDKIGTIAEDVRTDSSSTVAKVEDSSTVRIEPDSSHTQQDSIPIPDVRSLATRLPLAYIFVNPRGGQARSVDGFEDAMRNYVAADYHGAVSRLEQVAKNVPDNSEVLLYLGLSYYMKGNYAEAVKVFDSAEKLKPRTTRLAQVRWYRANSWLALNNPTKATPDLQLVANAKTDFAHEALTLVQNVQRMRQFE